MRLSHLTEMEKNINVRLLKASLWVLFSPSLFRPYFWLVSCPKWKKGSETWQMRREIAPTKDEKENVCPSREKEERKCLSKSLNPSFGQLIRRSSYHLPRRLQRNILPVLFFRKSSSKMMTSRIRERYERERRIVFFHLFFRFLFVIREDDEFQRG